MSGRARTSRLVAVLLGLALLAPWGGTPEPEPLAARLLGPLSGLAASYEWVRFGQQVHRGEDERAQLTARRALELDPRANAGWIHLAEHLVLQRASAEDEPDPAARARWMRAGIDLLERGEARCDDPGELAQVRGQLLGLHVAPLAAVGEVAWPGGAEAALHEARASLDRAEALGRRDAAAVRAALDRARATGDADPGDGTEPGSGDGSGG